MGFNITRTGKLLQRGRYSLDITIPSWWIEAHGLKSGDRVEVLASPDEVNIRPLRGG